MSPVCEWDNRKKLQEAPGAVHRGGLGVQRSPARIFPDKEHSGNEVREIIIGHFNAKRLLLVCFTESVVERIRIISARRATKTEQRDYEEHLKV